MKQRVVPYTDVSQPLPSFDTWISWPGEMVTGQGKKVEVRRIEWNGKSCFLKVSYSESWESVMRQWLYGRRAISSPELEAINLLALQKAGFAVVPVLAAGTAYRYGKALQGFMVTRAVNGCGLDQALSTLPRVQRSELLGYYGQLIARLHRFNYYEPLRCTDVLVDGNRFVLLDRTALPIRTTILGHRHRVRKSILRAAYRNRRAAVELTRNDIDDLCAGYADVDPGMVKVVRKALVRIFTASD